MQKKLTHRSTTRRVMFKKQAPVGATVYLAGDFNDWSVSDYPMLDRHGVGEFVCGVELEPGVYQYKFIVDGVWCLDENNPDFAVSPLGTYNSVVEVKAIKD